MKRQTGFTLIELIVVIVILNVPVLTPLIFSSDIGGHMCRIVLDQCAGIIRFKFYEDILEQFLEIIMFEGFQILTVLNCKNYSACLSQFNNDGIRL